jgi:hypothetical protein
MGRMDDMPVSGDVPHCLDCGSAAFQDLTPPGTFGLLHLLKCLRCGRRLLAAGKAAETRKIFKTLAGLWGGT